jgi:hypothetical protein
MDSNSEPTELDENFEGPNKRRSLRVTTTSKAKGKSKKG